ncbi:DNA recombination protein RmuC [Phenylobacterium sp.]|uniref:DNA recombination protein RmuC n=1 Tax=Phenylobacterium sp. TaxID=1871053 RepID=UPI0025E5CD86|nr:DNA recombination protein RmuC [Phenylobacterium sp.]
MSWLLMLTAAAAVLSFGIQLYGLYKRNSAPALHPELVAKLSTMEMAMKEMPAGVREEGRLIREDLRGAHTALQQWLETRFTTFGQSQGEQLALMRQEASDGRAKLEEAVKTTSEAFANTQTTRLGETNTAMKELAERLEKSHVVARDQQKLGLDAVGVKIAALTEANDKKQDAIREALTLSLDQLRKDNEAKLEQMRLTVDEKLQGTLEARLGESFKMVSDRLEQVHKGLGEMQTLATGVGDLKRVLTNVKSRGGWGEMQLGALLGDMLTPEQFDTNVRIRPDSPEIVEFAVRLPGKNDDRPLFLPIDAKFPQEDYDRLLLAQDAGLPDEVEKAGAALERAIRGQAKVICDKYVHPPYSTDFAIMYLPTEGLFAEIIRRPGLVSDLQNRHRVMLTGPTTLAALLSSLQMGFRTLTIEKRSSEVWQVLGAAKTEFGKYGQLWDKVGKQLGAAQNTVMEAGTRTRAIERTLRKVEMIELPGVIDELIALPTVATDSLAEVAG